MRPAKHSNNRSRKHSGYIEKEYTHTCGGRIVTLRQGLHECEKCRKIVLTWEIE